MTEWNTMKKKKTAKDAFSLIEVNLAILVAAGGLLAMISYFPLGLRQGVMAQEDMAQATFANSFFETVAENVRRIESVGEWDNIGRFCAKAMKGIDGTLGTIQQAESGVSIATAEIFSNSGVYAGNAAKFRYFWREESKAKTGSGGALALPPQFIARVVKIEDASSSPMPARYRITLISSGQPPPAVYHDNLLYHAEFYFNRRP